MNGSPAEDRALRLGCLTGLVSFLLGFVGLAAAGMYLVIQFRFPKEGWWAISSAIVWVLVMPAFAAAMAAVAVMKAVEWWQYRRGIFRCHHCGAPLRGFGVPCDCLPAEYHVHRHQPPRFRHYRKRLRAVLVTYLLLLPIAAALALATPHEVHSLAGEILMWHLLLCVIVAVAIEGMSMVFEYSGYRRRLRLRSTVFVRVFVVWPVAGSFLAALLTWLSWL